MFRRAVWVECMVLPSGSRTAIPGLAGRRLKLGAWMVMKWPVLPVSAMHVEVNREKGGAKVGTDGEETEGVGVMIAGTSISVIVGGRLVGATSTDNVRGGSAGPRS
jgi:hypothetical protein